MADEGFVERRTADRRAKKSGFPFILVIIIIAVVMGAGGFFAGKIFSGRGDILSTPASRIQTTPTPGQKSRHKHKEPLRAKYNRAGKMTTQK